MKESNKLDKPLLIVMFVFMIFGLIMVLSASSMASYMRYHNSIYFYLIRQGLFMVVGLFAFLIAIYFPTKFFKKNVTSLNGHINTITFWLIRLGSCL